MRIGIDVGGTHTDAVILNGDEVISATKSLTTADVVTGITNALDDILKSGGVREDQIQTVMIGTTQFTNAIVQRRSLSRMATIRIGLPSGLGMPPMVDWPDDMKGAVNAQVHMIHGGYLYDGYPLADLREAEITAIIEALKAENIKNIAIASAFSPMNAEPETKVGKAILDAIPEARLTLSHHFGRLGLLERENAAIMNTALLPFATKVVDAFLAALQSRGLKCPAFISQNDGTLMSSDFVRKFPALTFSSGPTNSLRGAFKLTGLEEAIVVDIGGTTSDIGVLQGGFPRESNVIVDIGGIRTNFRMPDIMAIGLGGGSLVSEDGRNIGPQSVGHRLVQDGLVFGGDTLTTTDIIVAAGAENIGDRQKVEGLNADLIKTATTTIHSKLDHAIDMMKPGGQSLPVILVGGGAILVTGKLKAASKLYRPENAGVANAIGAAIAQVGGEAERMVSYRNIAREEAIAQVTRAATDRALAAGADAKTIRSIDIEETAIPYMDEGATRLRVKVIGELAA